LKIERRILNIFFLMKCSIFNARSIHAALNYVFLS
jgi:hypothetical protein